MKRLRLLSLVCLMLPVFLGAFGTTLCLRAGLAEAVDITNAGPEEYRVLPYSGRNFQAYSLVGHTAGRCYIKNALGAAVLDAYTRLETSMPDRRFVYGEIGREGGGRFWPHRTHRQGLSVDFMTPMLLRTADGTGVPAVLPCRPWTLWGYGIRLDKAGRYGELEMDAEAVIAHLDALSKTTATYGLSIKLIIFDPPLVKILRASPNFSKIARLPFLPKAAWFPHDGHYHVDFR